MIAEGTFYFMASLESSRETFSKASGFVENEVIFAKMKNTWKTYCEPLKKHNSPCGVCKFLREGLTHL